MPPDPQFVSLLERSRSSSTSSTAGSSSGASRKRTDGAGLTATQYWLISCHRLGLIESASNGLRFGRNISLEPLPFESTRIKVERENPQLFTASPSTNKQQQYQYQSPAASVPDRIRSSITSPTPPADAALEPIEIPKEAAEVVEEAAAEDDDPSTLIALNKDRPSLSDFMFLTLKQAAVCHAVPADFETRGKKTKLLRLGFTGFYCRRCNQFRSFSSSSDNLASAVSNSFVLHLLKCPHTPRNIQQALQTLKRIHPKQMNQLPYGSQSRVFADLWARMRAADKKSNDNESFPMALNANEVRGRTNDDDDDEYIPDEPSSTERQVRGGNREKSAAPRQAQTTVPIVLDTSPVPERGLNFPVADDEETRKLLKELEENWDTSENDNLIRPEDRNLVSDYVFICMRQLKIAVPTSSDFKGNRRNNIINRMAGMCCIHCAELPGNQFIMPSGRTFPSAPDNMASALNVSMPLLSIVFRL
jgi:hypothetical protein